jgi:hypothetical protein
LLKLDLDATAGGVSDGLIGLVVEEVELQVVLQAAKGRPRRSGLDAGARAIHPSDKRTRGARWRAASCRWEWRGARVCVRERVQESASDYERNVLAKGPRMKCACLQGKIFANVSTGIDTKANARAAAHISLVICVSLRMAASAEAPLFPRLLLVRLQGMGEGSETAEVRVNADRKVNA